MAEIISTNGIEIIVDDEDFENMNKFNWHVGETGYATRVGKRSEGELHRKTISMHRMLMGYPHGKQVDHVDNNKLNNRKANLRICDYSQNYKNRTKSTSSRDYKGVRKIRHGNGYEVNIVVNRENIYLGTFTNEIAGANAYNYYAEIYHGEFANKNNVTHMDRNEFEKYKITSNNKYVGVSEEKSGLWRARITNKETGKREYFGGFDNELDACKCYNKRAMELYGINYKKLNKDDDGNVIL